MEDSLVKIAIRHILVTLAWVGLLLGHRALAQDWTGPSNVPAAQPTRPFRRGDSRFRRARPTTIAPVAQSDPSVVGEHSNADRRRIRRHAAGRLRILRRRRLPAADVVRVETRSR